MAGLSHRRHRTRSWPFPKRSEPACCKYLECVIEYAQYYLLGVFDQWTPERWLSSHACSTCLLKSPLHPFIPLPPNSSLVWPARLPVWSAQSAISPQLAFMGAINEPSLTCPARVAT